MSPPRDTLEAALAELASVYEELDAFLPGLGVACRACGTCCDFGRNDYRLYASFIERVPVAGNGRAVVRRREAPRLAASGRCAFQADGRCTIRPWRPLGCRVFFCAFEHKAREQAIYEEFQERLRALTERHGLPWDYAPFFQSE